MKRQTKKQQYLQHTRFHKPWELEPPLPWEKLVQDRNTPPDETGSQRRQSTTRSHTAEPSTAKSPRNPMLLSLADSTVKEAAAGLAPQAVMDRIRDLIIQSELNYPKHYAHTTHTSYGRLYHDPRAPSAWARNHAIIMDLSCDLNRAVDEIVAFYRSKGIEPGIFQAFRQSEEKILLPLLRKKGFDITYYHLTPLVLTHYPDITPGAQIKVKKIKKMDDALLHVIHRAGKGHWDNDSFKRRLQDEEIFLFTAENPDGQTVSMATLDIAPHISRIDDVFTSPQHRNNGWASRLLIHILDFHRKKSRHPVFLFSENDTATGMYQKLGFEKIDFKYPFWSAYMNMNE